MKYISLFLLLSISFLFYSCSNGSKSEKSVGNDAKKQSEELKLADPFILLDNGVYYAYGTQSSNGIMCYLSTDLQNWKPIDINEGLALRKEDSKFDKFFWAPEVYKLEAGRYAMMYSANEYICVAFANSPKGPFSDEIVQFDQPPYTKGIGGCSIDNSMFIDDDRQAYIYFDRFNAGNVIWGAKLDKETFEIDMSSLVELVRPTEDYETNEVNGNMVSEGPFMIKNSDYYMLTYSGAGFRSKHYNISFAYSKSPLGPFVKSEQNPVLVKPKTLLGVGHHSLFEDTDGNKLVVFHSHNSDSTISPRITHITSYSTGIDENGLPSMEVSDDYKTPVIIK